MRDAKGALQGNFIDLFGSAARTLTIRGEPLVRLRTPLCGGEQGARAMFVNELRVSFGTYSPEWL